ncbi:MULTISPECIES: YIP1 family protein [Halorussus]|uniref:YIP1 family protein n=1 Tax=Halorussus TaxID=1070314 RepID=UPI00209F40D4|nr:YIP1 family protein [Halorussus vallis]USZ75055.1 YIP1 family protein [Halorussus vallis]
MRGTDVPGWFDALVRPDAFFERRVPIRDLGPAKVLFAVTLAGTVPVAVATVLASPASPASPTSNRTPAAVVSAIAAVFVGIGGAVLLAWLFGSVLFCVGAWLVGGSFDLSETGSVMAYAMGPLGVEFLLVAALVAATAGVGAVAEFDAFVGHLDGGPPPFRTLALVTSCWQAYVATFGLKHANDLPPRRAALVSAAFVLPTVVEALA